MYFSKTISRCLQLGYALIFIKSIKKKEKVEAIIIILGAITKKKLVAIMIKLGAITKTSMLF